MSQVRLNDFAEIIDLALQNQISRDAKLILVGRISYALEIGELSFTEAHQLEEKLGGRQQWQEAYEIALSGETENSLYQLPA
jgi:thiazole synthase